MIPWRDFGQQLEGSDSVQKGQYSRPGGEEIEKDSEVVRERMRN